ncbi:hypothetical protein H4F04_13650 [Vibrio scophthalmi]|uniref:hypothetical protein n=1 Tax=Vibrio scophthalmi TaxID=45658 RepID=UPI002FF0A917
MSTKGLLITVMANLPIGKKVTTITHEKCVTSMNKRKCCEEKNARKETGLYHRGRANGGHTDSGLFFPFDTRGMVGSVHKNLQKNHQIGSGESVAKQAEKISQNRVKTPDRFAL